MIEVNTKELGSVSFPHHVAQFAIDYAEYFHILHDINGDFCLHLFTVPSDNPDMGEIQWNLLKYVDHQWSDSLEHGSVGFYKYEDTIPA